MAQRVSSVVYRFATAEDMPAIILGRLANPSDGWPDSRMTAYLQGMHHPQQALTPRTLVMASHDGRVVGYIGGHLTRRFGCDGELQYLFVASDHRRHGIATALLARLAAWFVEQGARRICVNVDAESVGAGPFYARRGAQALRPHWGVWPDIREMLGPR